MVYPVIALSNETAQNSADNYDSGILDISPGGNDTFQG